MRRDISALSRAAGRLRARLTENQELADKLGRIESTIEGISKYQAPFVTDPFVTPLFLCALCVPRSKITSRFDAPIHPAWLHCSSVK